MGILQKIYFMENLFGSPLFFLEKNNNQMKERQKFIFFISSSG